MSTKNLVIILGRLGADPELRHTKSGDAVCNLSVATDRYAKDASQKKTDWHRVSVWGKSAEAAAQYLKKGSEVLVQGEIRYSEYEKDGQRRFSTDIVAVGGVTFVGSRSDSHGKGDGTKEEGGYDPSESSFDEPPF